MLLKIKKLHDEEELWVEFLKINKTWNRKRNVDEVYVYENKKFKTFEIPNDYLIFLKSKNFDTTNMENESMLMSENKTDDQNTEDINKNEDDTATEITNVNLDDDLNNETYLIDYDLDNNENFNVFQFLKNLQLEKYYEVFQNNGFEDIDFLISNGLNDDDFKSMNIIDVNDIILIRKSIAEINEKFN
jgi:hypothetical protein